LTPKPPSLGQFSRQLRSLTATERAAFVADILTARGWDVDREGRLIVATRGGENKRVHVGAVPPDVDVDEVVVVPSRSVSVRAGLSGNADATEGDSGYAPDASVLDPATLHQQLLYAVERETAARLYRNHFHTDFRTDDGCRGPGPALSNRVAVTAVLLVAISVALPVLAGVFPAGPVWGDASPDSLSPADGDRPDETPAETGAGTGTPGTPEPAGAASLSPEDVRDPDRLARAHTGALRNRPVAMEATFTGPRFLTGFDTRRSGFDAEDTVTLRAHVESDSRYHVVRQTNFTGSPLTSVRWRFERFADGRTEYRRFEGKNSTEYERQSLGAVRNGSDSIATWTRFVLSRYLNTTRTEVETIGTGARPRYRLFATGEALALDHETRDYRAVAVVAPDGWISSLRVSYRHPDTGARVVVRVLYVRSPGAVDPPEWYEEVTTGSTPEP